MEVDKISVLKIELYYQLKRWSIRSRGKVRRNPGLIGELEFSISSGSRWSRTPEIAEQMGRETVERARERSDSAPGKTTTALAQTRPPIFSISISV